MAAVSPHRSSALAPAVQARRLPHPYRAMLAICSDLDETPSLETYLEQMRFLNTTDATSAGVGVGLEVGNSIYFDMPPGHFSYWNTTEQGREALRALMRSGHIDCLHSFGDLARSRTAAQRSWRELDEHGCRFKVWVDHAVAATNFGADIMCGHGDELGHPAYHADLAVEHGIRYVWRGRVTSVIGQDGPARLGKTFQARHPLASARTVAKEFAKQTLGGIGSRKYALHAANAILQPAHLRDGKPVWEFLRCNPHWGGVSAGDTGVGIAEVLTDHFLDALVEREGVGVLYTHLGKLGPAPSAAFGPGAVEAFRRLADYARAGKILVTTTARLLDFMCARNSVQVDAEYHGDELCILLRAKASNRSPALDGLTFYFDTAGPVSMSLNDQPVRDFVRNAPDHTGRPSVSLPWLSLKFPALP